MKILVDMSSLMWTALLAGKDVECKDAAREDGKIVSVNSAAYGYENAINMIVKTLDENAATPKDLILIVEGRDSKSKRKAISSAYKAGDSKIPEQYLQFNLLKDKLLTTLKNLGAIAVSQPLVEGDDVIAYLAQNMEEDCVIQTGDNDLAVLNGKNKFGADVVVRVGGEYARNKYGEFPHSLITLYKALVGDPSDKVKGVPGFGPKAFEDLYKQYGDDGCAELLYLLAAGKVDEVAKIADDAKCKLLQKVVDNWESAFTSYRLVLIHPEWVNTLDNQLEWSPGMVVEASDERLIKWGAKSRLVTASNYDAAIAFFKAKVKETNEFTIDFETTTPDESDDWLVGCGNAKGVDVIGSKIVSMGITFGANGQYGYYLSVNHKDTANVTLEQLVDILKLIPNNKHILAHNAAGFELPVAYNNFSHLMQESGWRGFIPNMLDTRIAASFWDENQMSHGLKTLSKLLLNYDQTSFDTVTNIDGVSYKMDGLSGKHVLSYGLDDVYTTQALWNFFKLFMQLEHTYQPFLKLEQKPMYLSALAYVQGLDIDIPRLSYLKQQDDVQYATSKSIVDTFLMEKGWDGCHCPEFTELTPASVKEAVQIVTGHELKTQVRKLDKLALLLAEVEGSELIVEALNKNDLHLLNKVVKTHFKGAPIFNVGSPKQISKLLYEVVKMPIRLRNKATEKMRLEGKREGTPRTDEDAINMAIKFGDVDGVEAKVLTNILTMKSCNTRKGLYWEPYPTMLHWKTGKLHPELMQSATNTRRWTGSRPNLQQQDSASDGVRSCTLPPRGKLFVSLDESSQEVRQVADYSQDETLLSCYVGDSLRDTHSIVGAKVAKVTYTEFIAMRKSEDKTIANNAKTIRQTAKVVLFATLYGAAAGKIGETLGISEDEAQTYIDAIFSEFPKVKKWKDETEAYALSKGYVNIAGGTKRHLQNLILSPNKWEASKALRQAGNARIQAAGANQIKTVMSAVWDSDLLDTTSLTWLFPCHDEICFAVSPEDGADVIERLWGFMTAQFMDTVPSESSVGIGKNYGQLVELEDAFASAGVRFSKEIVESTIKDLA